MGRSRVSCRAFRWERRLLAPTSRHDAQPHAEQHVGRDHNRRCMVLRSYPGIFAKVSECLRGDAVLVRESRLRVGWRVPETDQVHTCQETPPTSADHFPWVYTPYGVHIGAGWGMCFVHRNFSGISKLLEWCPEVCPPFFAKMRCTSLTFNITGTNDHPKRMHPVRLNFESGASSSQHELRRSCGIAARAEDVCPTSSHGESLENAFRQCIRYCAPASSASGQICTCS